MTELHGVRRRRVRERRERGAAVAEYALLLGAMLLGALAALDTVRGETEDRVEAFDVTSGDGTAAASTSTSSTTTTTSSTSSTTLPVTSPPETVPANHVEIVAWSVSWDDVAHTSWTAQWWVEVTNGGVAAEGVTVSATLTPTGGTSNTCTTDVSGQCTLVRDAIDPVEGSASVAVDGATEPWDGIASSDTVMRPPT